MSRNPVSKSASLALHVPMGCETLGACSSATPACPRTTRRLGRSLPHLIATITQLQERGVLFRSLTEQLDTTTSGGRLVFHVFAALAEFERDVIRERTQAGLAAARARGRRGGRPRAAALDDARKVALARALYADTRHSIAEICRTLGVSRSTLYRYIKGGRSRP